MEKNTLLLESKLLRITDNTGHTQEIENFSGTLTGHNYKLFGNKMGTAKVLLNKLVFFFFKPEKVELFTHRVDDGPKHDPYINTVDTYLEKEVIEYHKENERLKYLNKNLRLQTARFATGSNFYHEYSRYVRIINNCSGLTPKSLSALFLIITDAHEWRRFKRSGKNIVFFAPLFQDIQNIPHFTNLLAACSMVDYEEKINPILNYIDEYYTWLKNSPESPAYKQPETK